MPLPSLAWTVWLHVTLACLIVESYTLMLVPAEVLGDDGTGYWISVKHSKWQTSHTWDASEAAIARSQEQATE